MAQPSCYPECRHILTSGRNCQSPALRGQPLCHYHSRGQSLVEANRARKRSVALPPLEDRHALQLSLDEVLAAFAARKITRRETSTYLYALDLASRNFARMEQLPPPDPVPASNGGCPRSGCPRFSVFGDLGDHLAGAPEPSPILSKVPSSLGSGETPDPPTGEPSDPIPTQALLLDNTHVSDPEPTPPLTKTQLREKRRQIERDLRICRESRRYWASGPTDSPGTDPAVVLLYLDKDIAQLETELQVLNQQDIPDPPWDRSRIENQTENR